MSVLVVQERADETKPKNLRKDGILPMALVQKGGATVKVQAGLNDVKRALSKAHGAGMIDVQLGAQKPVSVVVKSVDRDIISRSMTHITFQQVSQDDTIRVDLPIVALGMPAMVAEGEAVLVHPTDHIKVRGKVSELPEHIEVDISGLGLHESISAGQVTLPAGVELMSSPDAQLFSVTIAKEPDLEVPTEETVEVPVVGEGEETTESEQ